MSGDGDGGSKEGGGGGGSFPGSAKAWIGLVVAVLGIPAAIYGAVEYWDKLFPPDPTITFSACSQENIQFTLYNRRQARATIRSVDFQIETSGKLAPLTMNASLEDPLAGERSIGPKGEKGQKEFPYPNDIDEYFTLKESQAQCKIHVRVGLQYEHQKNEMWERESCDCVYES